MAIINSFYIDGIDRISFVLNEDTDFPEEGPRFWVDAEYLSPFPLASASADTHEKATDGALLDLANVLWKMHQSVSIEYARRLRAKSELRTGSYFCAVCHEHFDDDPHTMPDGEDCHAACCPECNGNEDRK